MKKTYIKPQNTTLRIAHNLLISGSLTTSGPTGHATFYQTNATGEAMVKKNDSNHSNVWDDDWSK